MVQLSARLEQHPDRMQRHPLGVDLPHHQDSLTVPSRRFWGPGRSRRYLTQHLPHEGISSPLEPTLAILKVTLVLQLTKCSRALAIQDTTTKKKLSTNFQTSAPIHGVAGFGTPPVLLQRPGSTRSVVDRSLTLFR